MNFVLSAVVLCLGVKSSLAGNLGYGHRLTPQELIAIDASLALHGHSEVGSLTLKSGHGLADHLGLASLGHGLSLGQLSYGHGGGIALSGYGGHGGGYGLQALNLGPILTKQVVSVPRITQHLVGGPVLTKQILGAPVFTKQLVGAPVLSKQVVGAPVVSGTAGGHHGGGGAVLGAQIVSAPLTYAVPLKANGAVLGLGTPTYKSVRGGSVPLRISTVQAAPGLKSVHAAQLGGLSLGGLGGYGLHGLNLGIVGHGW